MLIEIRNLPPGTDSECVRRLLGGIECVGDIQLCSDGNPQRVVAWVKVAGSPAGIEALAHRLHGASCNGRTISATISLFFDT